MIETESRTIRLLRQKWDDDDDDDDKTVVRCWYYSMRMVAAAAAVVVAVELFVSIDDLVHLILWIRLVRIEVRYDYHEDWLALKLRLRDVNY